MGQKLTVKAKGLYTFPNPLSEVPNGGLLVADNVVIDREGTLEPRRGYSKLQGPLGDLTTNRANQIFPYGDYTISHYGPFGAPDTLAFYAQKSELSAVQTSGSPTISNMFDVTDLYAGQYVSETILEQTFVGDVTALSSNLTNVVSNQGLYIGQQVGGYGIVSGATITSISGTGPYIVGISSAAVKTLTGQIFTASNANLLSFPSNTTIASVSTTSITLSNNATSNGRSLTFAPSDVNVTSNIITIANHGMIDGQSVQFSSSGTLPAPLVAGTEYFVVESTGSTFKVSATFSGAALDITTQGSGTHTVTLRIDMEAFGWVPYTGSYTQPSSTTKMRSVEANSNVYFTSSQGIMKLDQINGTPIQAGAPAGLDAVAVLATGASGFMLADTQVAYRVVWGYKDANTNLILGVPSQRAVVANNGETTKDVEIEITIPAEVATNYFYQVYRSGFSADSDTEPNDEMALVYEANPSSADILAKTVSFTDRTPESLRTGATLYTSPSQEGIAQANEAPPFAKDVTLFKGSTFYANTKTKQNLTFTILAVSGQFAFTAVTTNVSGDTPTTISGLTETITGDTTSGSALISNASSVANISVGQGIAGSGIPVDSVVSQIVSSTSFRINNAATATAAATSLSLDVVGLLVGQQISGTGIPANTTVTEVYVPIQATGDTSSGSAIISNTSIAAASFKVGQPITGAGIPASTVVLSISGTNEITLSKNATATAATIALSFGNGVQISNAATAAGSTTITVRNGSNGIGLNDVLTISGVAYTAKLAENVAAKEFKLYAQGSPSQNISDTAKSLVRVINRTSSPTPNIYAYYQSGFSSLPGKILFKERTLGGTTFTAIASAHGNAYSPNLPVSGSTVSSSNDTYANGLYFSKTQQSEAVPLLNFARVGTANAPILRIIPLRDSLFILKSDGIFRLSGENPQNFRIDLFDSTSKIISAESAQALNNQIFMLSQEGVVQVSDTGVEAVSRYIEDKFLDIFEQDLTKVENFSFGISYETDRKYILFTITTSADTTCTQAFVWNAFTETWTRWVLAKTCGIVQPKQDLIYLGDSEINQFNVERKDRRYTDYVDDAFDDVLVSYEGKELVLDSTNNVEVGDVVYQAAGRFSLILAVDTATNTVTVSDELTSWALGNVAILKGIQSVIQYAPQTAENPGALKQFRECTLMFQIPFFTNIKISFDTDLSGAKETIVLNGQSGALWGLFPWGTVPWGGVPKALQLRTYVPQQKQRCSLLNTTITHKEAYSFFRLNGVSYIHNALSERVGV